jgi:hypothetical protein
MERIKLAQERTGKDPSTGQEEKRRKGFRGKGKKRKGSHWERKKRKGSHWERK